MTLIICDLDGTLCDCRHREHLVPDWDAFHKLVHLDTPHRMVMDLLKSVGTTQAFKSVIFLTGRPEYLRAETLSWLDRHGLSEGDDFIDLLMRPHDNYERDNDLKPRLLDESFQPGGAAHAFFMEWGLNPNDQEDRRENLLILEDREKMVAAFRDAGYVCWQTAQGAF